MLINISNLDTEYSDVQTYHTEADSFTLDRSLCYILASMLENLAAYTDDNPDSFGSLEDWKHSLRYHAECLYEYFNIQECVDEREELYITEDAKEAFRFVADHLEELWNKDESNI